MSSPSNLTGDEASLQLHFNELSKQYDTLIRRAFPAYEEVFDALFLFINPKPKSPKILELGVGSGNLTLRAFEAFPDAHYTLLDLSDEMLALSANKLKRQGIENYSLKQIGFMEADFAEGEFDLVLSSLALHHLQDGEKQALYGRVFKWLKPGGQFRCADGHLTLPGHVNHETVWQARIVELKALGVSDDEIQMWRSHEAQYDHFASLSTHFEWLKAAGFQQVDCYWKKLLLAVFGGQKP
ncbi:MAG: class I SAM-dependent methyltransferase [Vampirovibrionales bacterium]|nr:class I SAM-dependent methyltransferase [Vampirovibrionales bacterium]